MTKQTNDAILKNKIKRFQKIIIIATIIGAGFFLFDEYGVFSNPNHPYNNNAVKYKTDYMNCLKDEKLIVHIKNTPEFKTIKPISATSDLCIKEKYQFIGFLNDTRGVIYGDILFSKFERDIKHTLAGI